MNSHTLCYPGDRLGKSAFIYWASSCTHGLGTPRANGHELNPSANAPNKSRQEVAEGPAGVPGAG
jgi:hypothetical protein